MNFKEYKRTNIAEMAKITNDHILNGFESEVSISEVDKSNGSPRPGDMIARNPLNHDDQWLVAEKYFNENFKIIPITFLERLIEEQKELSEKISKLVEFLLTPIYKKLSTTEQNLLHKQLNYMGEYKEVLRMRIDYYENK